MIWYIIIAIVFLLLTWILVGPVVLTIDTSMNRYRFMLPGVVSVSLVPTAGFFRIRGWIFFVPFSLDPLKMGRKKKGRSKSQEQEAREEGKRTAKKKKKKKRGSDQMKKFRRIAGAIRIRRLDLDIDTDDYQVNAWLVPAFAVVNSYENIRMQVNFEGNLFLHMDVRTRVGVVIWRMLPLGK